VDVSLVVFFFFFFVGAFVGGVQVLVGVLRVCWL
jgi:hypothetical protein